MIKLKQIIAQLTPNDFVKISESLKKTKAENFFMLLKSYRENKLLDKEIIHLLNISSNSFYVLKSRLFDKIQNHLSENTFSNQENLIKELLQVPDICFNTPRETAIAFLSKLEQELLKYDLHHDLLIVYSALKKMHLYSNKYFHFSQQYNKHVALGLSLEKGEELLGNFNRILAQYCFSKNQDDLDTLRFLETELYNLYSLNQSRQIEIIKNILKLQLLIFCDENKGNGTLVIELIQKTKKTFSEIPESSPQKKWELVLEFLAFEYYVSIEEYKSAEPYFDKINAVFNTLLLYNNIAITSKFLISKIAFCCATDKVDVLIENLDNEQVFHDLDDMHANVLLTIYQSMYYFKQNKTKEAITTLNALINSFSFKNYFHELINVKLTISYFYLIQKEHDLVKNTLKSISRKIKAEQLEKYYHVFNLIKLFELEIGNNNSKKAMLKSKDLFTLFIANNKKSNQLLLHLIPDLKIMYTSPI